MCTYKTPSYGGRYNPNYGSGIHSGNAWKLTTVRGGQWARMKQAETGGGSCPKTTTQPKRNDGHAILSRDLLAAQKTGDGITKPELEQALAGKTELTDAERRMLGHFAKNQRLHGHKTFARQSTRQIAMSLAQGMTIAQAGAEFGLKT